MNISGKTWMRYRRQTKRQLGMKTFPSRGCRIHPRMLMYWERKQYDGYREAREAGWGSKVQQLGSRPLLLPKLLFTARHEVGFWVEVNQELTCIVVRSLGLFGENKLEIRSLSSLSRKPEEENCSQSVWRQWGPDSRSKALATPWKQRFTPDFSIMQRTKLDSKTISTSEEWPSCEPVMP